MQPSAIPGHAYMRLNRTLPFPRICGLFLLLILPVGCAPQPVNPSFAVSDDEAKRAIKAMSSDPKPLERPVVVLGGYHDPGIGPTAFLSKLRAADIARRLRGETPFTNSPPAPLPQK